jgi:hypothetical protein
LPTESPGKHYQKDVLSIITDGWDLMIAHPPCQYLSYAGMQVWNQSNRDKHRQAAMDFFMALYNAPIPRVCVENPRGYPFTAFRSPDQMIQPYFWGEPFIKTTYLWLKNLPCLFHLDQPGLFDYKATHTKKPAPYGYSPNGTPVYWTEKVTGKNRSQIRSRFWPGIAKAMAEQWG